MQTTATAEIAVRPALQLVVTSHPAPVLTLVRPLAKALPRPAVKPAWTAGPRFAPLLSSAVFGTRWLDTYATPCHAQGRSF